VLALAPWAGNAADRYDRRKLLLVAQSTAVVLSAAVGLLAFAELATPAVVIGFALALGVVSGFSAPAQQALVPSLVEPHDLGSAVALNSMTFNIARASGPALAAGAIAAFGIPTAFLINAGSYLIFVVALLRVSPRPQRRAPHARLRESLELLRSQPRLVWLLLVVMAAGFGSDPVNTLAPAFAEEFGRPDTFAGVIIGVFGAGAVTAALLFAGREGSRRLTVGTLTLLGGGMIAVCLSPVLAVAIPFLFVAGIGYLASNARATTQLQLEVEESQRGRIMALWSVAFLGLRPFASLVDGALAGAFGVRVAGVVLALPALVMAVLIARRLRRVTAAAPVVVSHTWAGRTSEMRYRRLGSSDLVVSEIALGSWLTYSGGVSREAAEACVDRAFDVGITLIDTANVYGRGKAEELLGDILAERPRDSYVLATKVYFPMSDRDRGLSRVQIEKQIDASLRRLRVDYVDLYQCHRYDAETPLAETMEALSDVVRQGKARYIGFSEWTAAQIQASLDLRGVEKFVSSQPEYSLLQRRVEHDVIPLCEANGISQIVWSPLAQGALTGKYKPGVAPPENSRATSSSMGTFIGRFLRNDLLEAVQRLGGIAEALGITTTQLALAWVLRQPNVAAAIVGATRPQQVEENAAASGVELDDATLAEIDLVFSGVGVSGV
jgi:aryl-alcohol dehydrogenase-like predicted oxidoreductase/predicted MFS family arabinose efflux permease